MDKASFFLLFFYCVCAAMTAFGILYYKKIAKHYDIVAKKNFRTLHEVEVPRGSGLVLGIVFLIGVSSLWLTSYLDPFLCFIFLTGGVGALLFGFVDDVINVNAGAQFFIQVILSFFILYSFYQSQIGSAFFENNIVVRTALILLLTVAIVWFLNLINFIDGSDGLLAACTCCICLMLCYLLYQNQTNLDVMILSALLGVVCLTFLFFNWPPASVFMGDAGSLFIAFSIGVFVAITIGSSISIWLWLIILAYILADTCLTLVLRIILVKKWYGAHRSHAYQNFVRVRKEHKSVLYIIVSYHLLWLMPLLILAVNYSEYQIFFAILAISPVIVWTLKYGPLLSSD